MVQFEENDDEIYRENWEFLEKLGLGRKLGKVGMIVRLQLKDEDTGRYELVRLQKVHVCSFHQGFVQQ